MKGKLVIEIQADGSIKTDARALEGSEADILAELQALADSGLGGDLTVEKHEKGVKHHHHHHGKGGHHHHH
jgi:hypothetical protein